MFRAVFSPWRVSLPDTVTSSATATQLIGVIVVVTCSSVSLKSHHAIYPSRFAHHALQYIYNTLQDYSARFRSINTSEKIQYWLLTDAGT